MKEEGQDDLQSSLPIPSIALDLQGLLGYLHPCIFVHRRQSSRPSSRLSIFPSYCL